MPLRLFLSVSIVIHILIAIGIYYLPSPKRPDKQGFETRLVTPDETRRPEVTPPVPRPALRPQAEHPAPPAGRPQFRPPDVSSERPVVPGEGSEAGTPLPKGQKPSAAPAPGQSSDVFRDSKPETGPGIEPAKSGRSAGAVRRQGSTRSQLFDPAITAEIAGKDASARAGRDDAITFDTRDYRYAGYMNKLRDKIQSIWVYPPSAAAEGKYGDLKIRFTINKNGKLAKVELVRTSGYKLLDDAAIKALKDGEPYWPLPEEWGMESYSILGHFIYSLYGFQQLR